MAHTLFKTKSEEMLRIARLYVEQGGAEPIELNDLASFAIENGHWDKHGIKNLQLQLCKKDFSRAFREQYHVDPQGRNVRTYHAKIDYCGPKNQKTFWEDIRKATEEYASIAFHQRRSRIVGDCRQLKTDVDSYNDNNSHGGYCQLPLDFTEDVAEREQPSKYNPKQPR